MSYTIMTRDELIEAMARAVHETMVAQAIFEYLNSPFDATVIAQAAITAIEAQGLAIVPVEATDTQSKVGDRKMVLLAGPSGIYNSMIQAGKL